MGVGLQSKEMRTCSLFFFQIEPSLYRRNAIGGCGHAKPWSHPIRKEMQIDNERLKHAYIQSAHIVSRYGDIYLPIFERLEAEYKKCADRDELLTRAKGISIANKVD